MVRILTYGSACWWRAQLGRYTCRSACAYRKHLQSVMGQTLLATLRLTAFYKNQLDNPIILRVQRRAALIENLWVNARLIWRADPLAAAADCRHLVQLQFWNLAALGGWILSKARVWPFRRQTL